MIESSSPLTLEQAVTGLAVKTATDGGQPPWTGPTQVDATTSCSGLRSERSTCVPQWIAVQRKGDWLSNQYFGLELRSTCASLFMQQMTQEFFDATAPLDSQGFSWNP